VFTGRARGAGARAALAAVALVVSGGAAEATVPSSATWGDTTSRASVGGNGQEADGESRDGSVSAHGRFVAFTSVATNLVAGDTNGLPDVFLRDRASGETRRVSVGPDGRQADGPSGRPDVSASTRVVVFESEASNLVSGDTNQASDVFLRHLESGLTRRVSTGPGGRQGDAGSGLPAISADGRFVAFTSFASNLVTDDPNGVEDVFVRSLRTGTTRRVSVATGGARGNADGHYLPAISARGRFVAFTSTSPDLVPGDRNGFTDVFVRDRWSGTTRRVSIGARGVEAGSSSFSPAISGDGRLVAFASGASNLVAGDTNGGTDVFVRNLRTGLTRRVSVRSDESQAAASDVDPLPDLSRDGRFVSFTSLAADLVPGDSNGASDAFVRDRWRGTTLIASISTDGKQGPRFNSALRLSADGRHLAFVSNAPNLVPDDTNAVADVLVRHMTGDQPDPP
jgi:Tol biopolymer transport system component